jgi:lipopolysaccharide biosynthesis protein
VRRGWSLMRRLAYLPRPGVALLLQRLRMLAVRLPEGEQRWAEPRDARYEEILPIDLQGESPGAVRILAFFLPQFHRDPVNEQAWGRGFTEWRNVTKARPLFAGHQQPKLPADLGFYNLTCPQAWAEQQELTSRYGIEGFVLYHYWFAGVCPLEASLRTLLSHPQINQKFCLCWANESWTRRWDGGNEEVILGQDYAGESPEALADYLLPFLRDPRYIKEVGKPIYLIYRPDALPDAADFLGRLRERLWANGLEISLGRVLSFRADPQDGLRDLFDFAVQFPVHGSYGQLNPCTAATPLRGVFDPLQLSQTTVIHYQAWAKEQARCYQQLMAESAGGLPVFPAVMPDFDNTARRGNRGGTIFLNHRGRAFCDWTQTVLRLLRRLNFVNQKRFVKQPILFLTSWNEWAEGSMMEPSLQLGYHYLNELYRACVVTDPEREEILLASRIGFERRHSDALIYHLYYPDLVDEAVRVLARCCGSFDVYLSVSSLISAPQLRRLIAACSGRVIISEFPNCGYDIYPFFRYIDDPDLNILGHYRWILKLHSKRSDHRADGPEWSQALQDALCGLDLNQIEAEVGLVMPEMSTLRVSDFVGSNRREIQVVLQLLEVPESALQHSHFAAGSMYLIRSECFKLFESQLHRIGGLLSEEGYRIDGSYAHAMERCMQAIAYKAGFHMRSSAGLPLRPGSSV